MAGARLRVAPANLCCILTAAFYRQPDNRLLLAGPWLDAFFVSLCGGMVYRMSFTSPLCRLVSTVHVFGDAVGSLCYIHLG